MLCLLLEKASEDQCPVYALQKTMQAGHTVQCSVADRCLTVVEEWCGDCCPAFVLQEAKRAGHTVHVAKLTHRLAMHFAERLKRPQEGVNLLKVSQPVYSSTQQS